MAASTDPFTQVYDRLWAILTGRAAWAALVDPGNRINFSGDNENPIKDKVNLGDLPQATLMMGAFDFPGYLDGSSTCARFTQSYNLQLLARDLRIDKLNNLKFQTVSALHVAGPHLGLTDASAAQVGPFVENWRIQNGSDAITTSDQTLRWRSVLDIIVTMEWPRGAFT